MEMLVSLWISGILVIIGLALLILPGQLARLSDFLNRRIFEDDNILRHRRFIAVLCFIAGGVLFAASQGYLDFIFKAT